VVTDSQLSGLQRVASALSHAGFFLLMPFLLPFVIWLLFPRLFDDPNNHVREQSFQAMFFHMIVVVVNSALWGATYGLFAIILIGWPFAIVMGLVASVFSIWSVIVMLIAVVKTAMGEPYRLPLVGGRLSG